LENVGGETKSLENSILLSQVHTEASLEIVIRRGRCSEKINFTCKIAEDKVFSLTQTAIIDLDGRAQLQTSLIQQNALELTYERRREHEAFRKITPAPSIPVE
jgi:hypothetical protein